MAEEDSMVASKFEAEESSSQQAQNLVRDVDKVQQWKDEGKVSIFQHFYFNFYSVYFQLVLIHVTNSIIEMAANTMGGGGISSVFVVIPCKWRFLLLKLT